MKKLVLLMIISLVSRKGTGTIDRATDSQQLRRRWKAALLWGNAKRYFDISFRDNYGYTNYDHTGEAKAGQPTNVIKEDEPCFRTAERNHPRKNREQLLKRRQPLTTINLKTPGNIAKSQDKQGQPTKRKRKDNN